MTPSPMFPLEVAMLPGEELPLKVFEPRYTALVEQCLTLPDPVFGVVLIEAGREVGGGDTRSDVGALARIAGAASLGSGRYGVRCVVGERIRVLEWLPDDPYPRAAIQRWPDDSGPPVTAAQLADLEDRIMEIFGRMAAGRGVELPPRIQLLGDVEPGQNAGDRLFALASRIPLGQADPYSVLAAPTAYARLDALTEALDTVEALVEFQLSGD